MKKSILRRFKPSSPPAYSVEPPRDFVEPNTPSDLNDPSGKPPKAKNAATNIKDPLALVLVGADEVQFSLRTSLLTRSSTFFRTACKSRWFECSHIIRLLDTDSRTFEIYVCWLFTGKFVPAQHINDDPNGTTASNEKAGLLHRPVDAFPTDVGNGKAVTRLYILGTSLLDQKFCNAVMDALYHSYYVTPTNGLHGHQVCLANFAYDRLPRRCGLCRFLCVKIIRHSSEHLELLRQKMKRELLEDVALGLGWCDYRYRVQYNNTRPEDYFD